MTGAHDMRAIDEACIGLRNIRFHDSLNAFTIEDYRPRVTTLPFPQQARQGFPIWRRSALLGARRPARLPADGLLGLRAG